MAEIDVGDDSVRRIGAAAKSEEKPWRADRRAREGSGAQRAAPATTTSADDQASLIRGLRAEESPQAAVDENVLGFRDTTVVDDDTPVAARPKSHKRKVASQEAPKPPAPHVPFDPNLSNLLLGLAQGMFTAAWGPQAAFTDNERKMIEPPLGRMMQRMQPDDAAKFAAFADPVLLAAGILIWGMRIWTMQQRAVRPVQQPMGRPTGPVVQGMPSTESMVGYPADEIVTHHESGATATPNGSANVASHIAEEWGSI